MTEHEWLSTGDVRPMLAAGHLSDGRKLRLFCVASCVRVLGYFFDERSRAAVKAAELFADGLITDEELSLANRAANSARSIQEGNFYTLDAGWECTQQPTGAASCAEACAEAAGLGFVKGFSRDYDSDRERTELKAQADLLRDIFGNPFRPVGFDPSWRTSTVVALAEQMYGSRDFSPMPVLADALQDAGCDNDGILAHCRGAGPHVRACWVVDLVLGKS